MSGGAPYSILVPNTAIDGILENESHQTTLVNYLRICLQQGGFPGVRHHAIHFPILAKVLLMNISSNTSCRQNLFRIFRIIDAFHRRDPFRNLFAVYHLQGQLEELWPQQRVAFNGGIQFPINHRLEGVADGIDRDDFNILSRVSGHNSQSL